jgi:hypothetical protein
MKFKVLNHTVYSKNPLNKKEVHLHLYLPELADDRSYFWSKKAKKTHYYYNIRRLFDFLKDKNVTESTYWGLLSLHGDSIFYDEALVDLMENRYNIFVPQFLNMYKRQMIVLRAKHKIHPVDEKLWDYSWHAFFVTDKIDCARNEDFDFHRDVASYENTLQERISNEFNWLDFIKSYQEKLYKKESL